MKVFISLLHHPCINTDPKAQLLNRIPSSGCTLRGLVALGTLANNDKGRQRIREVGAPVRVKSVVERAHADSDVRSFGNEMLDVLGVGAVDELELD